MATKFDSESRKTISTSASSVSSPALHPPKFTAHFDSVNGPHESTTDFVEKQIDLSLEERCARNSHLPVSRLPAEILSEVFLHLVESGIRGGNTYFAHGTFSFLQVCKRWSEVAVSFPRLWSSWIVGAFKAWPLFKSRSKDCPLSLTWRPQLPNSARGVLMDPAIPTRTRQLDFSGTNDQLAYFLAAFDPSPPSNASFIRLQVFPYEGLEPRENFARLLSSPFPKLSKLNLGNFLPDPSSSIYTTSKLTSLKLSFPYGENGRYTLAQFARILQRHPTLEELDLNHGAIPLSVTSGTPVSFILPRLVNLRLYGAKGAIIGLVDLIGMSSPLHDIAIHVDYTPDFTIPALVSTMEKIVVPYYNGQRVKHSRKINNLTISSRMNDLYLTFEAKSHSAPPSNLVVQFLWVGELGCGKVVDGTFDLLPSNDVQELTIEGFPITRKMLQKMNKLSHLRLCNQDRQGIKESLDALSLGNRGVSTNLP